MLKWEQQHLEGDGLFHPYHFTAQTPFGTMYVVSWEHPGAHALVLDEDGYYNTAEVIAKFGDPEPMNSPHCIAEHSQDEDYAEIEKLGGGFTLEQAKLFCENDFTFRIAACLELAEAPAETA